MSSAADPPLALSCGEPAGIGGEIAAAAWTRLREELAFCLIGDADWAAGFGVPVARIAAVEEAGRAMADGLPVLHRPFPTPPVAGRPQPETAAAVAAAIAEGAALAQAGRAGGLVTLPISKAVLKAGTDFPHPGHTEYLAALTGAALPVMMLAGPSMRVAPATVHIPLAEVPHALTAALIEATGRVLAADLGRWFGLAAPRIAVAGLNPHAGEAGLLGAEDAAVIAPAVAALRRAGIDAVGPLPADAMFHARARAGWDAALCMYHDQALIPLKTLDFDEGVNVTLGLPIVRTSPDHGTAFDIAGTGAADPGSLIAALRMAWAMAARAPTAAPAPAG